jgi:hypothetical protein
MPKPTVLTWLNNAPYVLITSPNFVWACISLAVYYFAPYDLANIDHCGTCVLDKKIVVPVNKTNNDGTALTVSKTK